jgi:guanine deaminase
VSRLLIRGATVLDPFTPLGRADIRIAEGRIIEVGRSLEPDGEEEINGRDRIAMPGLINAHTHSGQSLDRGTSLNLPLDLWMVWSIYGGRKQSADDAYTTAAAGALEMLRSGCTTVLDQVYIPAEDFEAHAGAVMSAYEDLGIRAAVAPMVQDRDFLESLQLQVGSSGEPLAQITPNYEPKWLIECLTGFLDAWKAKSDTLVPMLGPTAPQRCSDEFLALVADLATQRRARVHTHLLETKTQRLASERRYGRSLVDHLEALGYLTSHTSFAHGIWLTPEEYRRVGTSGATIVHNPVSNMRCGSGVMPLQYLFREHLPVALGSDGAASNDSQNMFEVLKVASMLHTLYGGFRDWPQPEDLWRACLLGGAAAVGQPVGRIAPGSAADIVLLRSERYALSPRPHLVAALVNAEHGESVDTVVVGGRVVVREGASTRVDERAISAAAHGFMERSVAAFESRRATYSRYERQIASSIDDAAIDAMEPVSWWRS